MDVDEEETPEQRLARAQAGLRMIMPSTKEYLEKAALVTNLKHWVANRKVAALLEEHKEATEAGEADRTSALAEKIELAEAEAKLAEAEAKLAQAEADGKPTEALTNLVASLNGTVQQLRAAREQPRRGHKRGGSGDTLPPAKRLRLLVADESVHAPEKPPSELIGRQEAVRVIRRVARLNFEARGEIDHARHHFLTFNGHVRSGKTRMGQEAPRILDELAVENPKLQWHPAAYVPVRFHNGSQFYPQLDEAPGNAMAAKLSARLAAAIGLVVTGKNDAKVPLSDMSWRDAQSLELERVLQQLADRHLRDAPEGTVLPIVLHFDEYGHYVKAAQAALAAQAGKAAAAASNAFVDMLRCIGSFMSSGDKKRKFFLVPVTTGTSLQDSSFNCISGYTLWRPPLPLLTLEQSVQAARSFWACENLKLGEERSHGACPIGEEGEIPPGDEAQLFAVALADAGGYPGYIQMLCAGGRQGSGNYGARLYASVTAYADRSLHTPPAALWIKVVRKMLTREVMRLGDSLAFTLDERADASPAAAGLVEGPSVQKLSVQKLIDRGYVMPNWLPTVEGAPGIELRLSVPPSMLRHWLPRGGAGVFDTSLIGDNSKSRPEHWQNFENFHAGFLAARLAALRHEPLRGGNKLAHVLPGAEPRENRLLRRSVEPAVEEALVEYDEHWVVTLNQGGFQAGIKECKVPTACGNAVHICAKNNPIFDAYVDAGGVYLFLQYKFRELGSKTTHKTSEILQGARWLRKALKKSKTWKRRWKEGRVVFVWVTNAPLVADKPLPADGSVFLIGAEQLVEHLGAEFAGRGLLAHT